MKVVDIQEAQNQTTVSIPLTESAVSAGFATVADEFIEKSLDLNEYIIKHPAATFYVRVEGDSMINAGIHSGDLLVVDRALTPTSGKVVVAIYNGEFTVKTLHITEKSISLIPANPKYRTIHIDPEADFKIWGIVTFVIHKV